MRNALFLALALLVACPFAKADLKDYIDEQTTFAGEVDLTKVDLAALEKWLREMADAIGAFEDNDRARAGFEKAIAESKRWVGEFVRAGGTKIYLVTTEELMKDGAVAIIAPAERGKAGPLASMLFSGKPDGPTSRPNMTRENTGRLYPQWAEVIRDGKAAVYGTGNARKYAKAVTPKDQPDLTAALAAVGDVPAKMAFVPTGEIRQQLQMFLDTRNVQWFAVGAGAPPKPALVIQARATDAAAAGRVKDQVITLLRSIPPRAKITPKFIELVTPTVADDRVTLALDGDKLLAMAHELKSTVAGARLQAKTTASLSHMRQILVACMMYASEHRKEWPANLAAAEKYLGVAAEQVLNNPTRPGMGYVYFKPAQPIKDASTHVVLYEEHDAFGDGVAVGFADGHVEFIKDEARFKALTAK
jgi:prepilin-type processing-associated H-X9-DG protein